MATVLRVVPAALSAVVLLSACTQEVRRVDLAALLARETAMVDGGRMLFSESLGARGTLFVSLDPYCEPVPGFDETMRAVVGKLPGGFALVAYFPGRTANDLVGIDHAALDQLGLPQFLDSDCGLAKGLGARTAFEALLINADGQLLFTGPVGANASNNAQDPLFLALEANARRTTFMDDVPLTGCLLKCDLPPAVH